MKSSYCIWIIYKHILPFVCSHVWTPTRILRTTSLVSSSMKFDQDIDLLFSEQDIDVGGEDKLRWNGRWGWCPSELLILEKYQIPQKIEGLLPRWLVLVLQAAVLSSILNAPPNLDNGHTYLHIQPIFTLATGLLAASHAINFQPCPALVHVLSCLLIDCENSY